MHYLFFTDLTGKREHALRRIRGNTRNKALREARTTVCETGNGMLSSNCKAGNEAEMKLAKYLNGVKDVKNFMAIYKSDSGINQSAFPLPDVMVNQGPVVGRGVTVKRGI